MPENAKLREKHKWAIEKPTLNNATRLRRIYFIDPDDMEFQEIIQNARRKLETPMAPAMLCKTCKKTSMERPVARLMISSLSLHVSWKPVKPQECVWKNLYQNIMRTTSQEKETIRYSISKWYKQFILMPQAMKKPAAKAAVVTEWAHFEKDSCLGQKSETNLK